MRVLDRKEGETIIVAGLVKFTILKHTNRTTKVGIEAPPEFRILRGEHLDAAMLQGREVQEASLG